MKSSTSQGVKPLRAFGLEECVLEDLEAAVGRVDDLEPEMQTKFPWTEANVRISSAEGTAA